MALTKAHNRMIDSAAVNVKDFGAVGYTTIASASTGTASNAAFEAAIASLPSYGGVINIPAGYYRLDGTLRIEKNGVIFKGSGGGVPTGLVQTQDVDNVYVDNAPAGSPPFGIEFHDLWFLGYYVSGVSQGTAANLRIDDGFLCRISNCYFENGGTGISLNNASDIIIDNCFIEDSSYGITAVASSSILINNIKLIELNSLSGVANSYAIKLNSTTGKCVISNVVVLDSGNTLYNGIEIYGEGNQINNCFIKGTDNIGVLLTGATCSHNNLSNFVLDDCDKALRLETNAANNNLLNFSLTNNLVVGIDISSTCGANNSLSGFNCSSNTLDASMNDTVSEVTKFTAMSFLPVSGATGSRPGANVGRVVGYMYFDTTRGEPVWYTGSGVWKNAAGTTV